MDETLPIIEQKETIKLIKNSKGYNWEIKLCALALQPQSDIDRLELMNNKMKERFSTNDSLE